MTTAVKNSPQGYIVGLSFGVCFIIATIIMGTYILKARQVPRKVTVRGLAEREVRANVGVWTINFQLASDDLADLQKQVERRRKLIADFLVKRGFLEKELTYGIPFIDDKESRDYNVERKMRYAARNSLSVCTENVALLEEVVQRSAELIAQGVCFEERWGGGLKFIFTNLNSIKPSMIQEATLEARKAAEQFAKDAGCQVGAINQATQGIFSIEDTHIPTQKHVRVVTTVEYELLTQK
jgi:hypothetical protein